MKEKILIVDDEERMRKLIGAYLLKEGYEIFEAENGVQAINIFRSQNAHLIILDIMMPVMDGWSACREIRKSSNVPIIFLTAKGEDEDKLLGFELGTDHYVTKPFNEDSYCKGKITFKSGLQVGSKAKKRIFL